MDTAAIQDDITAISVELILNEPFYGHLFSTITKVISGAIPTMGVKQDTRQGNILLAVNPQFWTQSILDKKHKYGALKHEILHIVFKHILMTDRFEDPQLANVAMDLVVNQYISPDLLPDGAILLENYPHLRFVRDRDVEYYYDRLKSFKTGQPEGEQLAIDIRKFANDALLGNHDHWGTLNELQKRILESNINQVIRETITRSKKTLVDLPDGLRTYLDGLLSPQRPAVNWRRALRQFATTSQRTFLKNTIKRASRRYGTVPGTKLRHRNRLLVVIDTSSSIDDADLDSFFRELRHIYRQGAEIMVVECDARIRNTYPYHGQTPDFVTGREATDFAQPIVWANETYLPDAIIYFTDGRAEPPKVHPRAPIMWLITEGGIGEEEWKELPGIKVKMDNFL